MVRATVTVLLLLVAATLGAAQAPSVSPEASEVTGAPTPAKSPEATRKAKSLEAAPAPASRKSGPAAAAPTSRSSQATSTPDASVSVSAGDVPSPPAPLAKISPIADGPAEDPADAENSGTSALWYSATVAMVAGAVVAAVIFA